MDDNDGLMSLWWKEKKGGKEAKGIKNKKKKELFVEARFATGGCLICGSICVWW